MRARTRFSETILEVVRWWKLGRRGCGGFSDRLIAVSVNVWVAASSWWWQCERNL